jgi:hypothetical protein
MKLEFLNDITDNGKYPWADPDKLIRLYDFDQLEAKLLIDVIQTRIIKDQESVELSTLDFIQPVNCNLRFELALNDVGIDDASDNKFVGMFSSEGYESMLNYMSAFVGEENNLAGYNWLYDPPIDKIDLLFSPGGTW